MFASMPAPATSVAVGDWITTWSRFGPGTSPLRLVVGIEKIDFGMGTAHRFTFDSGDTLSVPTDSLVGRP